MEINAQSRGPLKKKQEKRRKKTVKGGATDAVQVVQYQRRRHRRPKLSSSTVARYLPFGPHRFVHLKFNKILTGYKINSHPLVIRSIRNEFS